MVPNNVRDGYRLQKPDACPDSLYTMMLQTWDQDPAARPAFTTIRKALEQLEEQVCLTPGWASCVESGLVAPYFHTLLASRLDLTLSLSLSSGSMCDLLF